MRDIIERLERAEVELQAAENQLNDNARKCECCGLTIRENFSETQMKESLRGIRAKLNRYRLTLQSKQGQDPLPNRT